MTPLKQAIKESGKTQKTVAAEWQVTEDGVSKMNKTGYAVDSAGRVWRPTKYTIV